MLKSLRKLEAEIEAAYLTSEDLRACGLAQVSNATAMACRALELALATTGADLWRNDTERLDWCLELVQTITNAAFIQGRNIDRKGAA